MSKPEITGHLVRHAEFDPRSGEEVYQTINEGANRFHEGKIAGSSLAELAVQATKEAGEYNLPGSLTKQGREMARQVGHAFADGLDERVPTWVVVIPGPSTESSGWPNNAYAKLRHQEGVEGLPYRFGNRFTETAQSFVDGIKDASNKNVTVDVAPVDPALAEPPINFSPTAISLGKPANYVKKTAEQAVQSAGDSAGNPFGYYVKNHPEVVEAIEHTTAEAVQKGHTDTDTSGDRTASEIAEDVFGLFEDYASTLASEEQVAQFMSDGGKVEIVAIGSAAGMSSFGTHGLGVEGYADKKPGALETTRIGLRLDDGGRLAPEFLGRTNLGNRGQTTKKD